MITERLCHLPTHLAGSLVHERRLAQGRGLHCRPGAQSMV